MSAPEAPSPGDATRQRLLAVAPEILGPEASALADAGGGVVASALAEAVRVSGDDAHAWLLFTALAARFPNAEQVRSARRRLVLAPRGQALTELLESAWGLGLQSTELASTLELVTDAVVVDVDFSAKYRLNTGIQRVVRELAPRWAREHDPVLVCWTSGDDLYRRLRDSERERVLDWPRVSRDPALSDEEQRGSTGHIVVPVRSVLVLAEVPQGHLAPPLAALAEFSGNRVAAIGYDTIPIGSADSMPPMESEKFAHYLSVVKRADRIAGISDAASAEFEGFAAALPAQGLPAPVVVSVPLAVDVPSGHAQSAADARTDPLVLVVGSRDERKNHAAVLAAAERLRDEGAHLTLRFIGGGSSAYARHVEREAKRVSHDGLTVEILTRADDDTLMRSYREARFTVFPSTHEGYGLPVAESLALGVPALTSDYGSTREIGEAGGAILVDPRDDDAIADAMRALLFDDDLVASLRDEARTRTGRTWDAYSRELWAQLVEPLRGARS